MAILASTSNEDTILRRHSTYIAPGAPARRSVTADAATTAEGRKSLHGGALRVPKRLRFQAADESGSAPARTEVTEAPAWSRS